MTDSWNFKIIKELERAAASCGFSLGIDNIHTQSNNLCLYPNSDSLPIYNDKMPFISGSAEELLYYCYGWTKALDYLKLLKISNDKKIQKAHQIYKNKKLISMIKFGDKNDNK